MIHAHTSNLYYFLLSSVASIFNANKESLKYGSMISARVPFVEEAVKEFMSMSERERLPYKKSTDQLESFNNSSDYKTAKKTDTSGIGNKQFVVASIMLAIKGDHTSSPFQSGVSTKKDMGRALLRVATDAKVESCLVGTEVMWMPHQLDSKQTITENDILNKFPDIVPLS